MYYVIIHREMDEMHLIQRNIASTIAPGVDYDNHTSQYVERDSSDIIKSYLSLNDLEDEDEVKGDHTVTKNTTDSYSSSRTGSTADESYANSPSSNLQRLVNQFETYKVGDDGSMLNTSTYQSVRSPSAAITNSNSNHNHLNGNDTSYNKAKLSLQQMTQKLAGKK